MAKRLEHLQSPGGVTLSLTGMAALLGLPAEGLEGALRGVAPLRRSAHDQWFRWDDIKHRLGDDVLAQLRARLWEQRSRGPVSKRWIALTDTYGVETAPGEDDVLILASVLALDVAEDRERSE